MMSQTESFLFFDSLQKALSIRIKIDKNKELFIKTKEAFSVSIPFI